MGDNTFSYVYDPIGNRITATNNSEAVSYFANALNQYTNVTDGAAVSPAYDPDGNMLTNGPWAYTWDAEIKRAPSPRRSRRATAILRPDRRAGARSGIPRRSGNRYRMSSACSNGVLLVTNVYDHQSRRIRKEVRVRETPSFEFQVSRSHTFLYDGWNVVRETMAVGSGSTQSVATNYYTWSTDLSGTQQGAGGVGGLLAVTCVSSGTSNQLPLTYYPLYDANGNVTAYLGATNGLAAVFEYDAFGNKMAEFVAPGLHLPFQFSTKYCDTETGLDMYQLRPYIPELGRFTCPDPIGEEGGLNLYGFVGNDAVDRSDSLGLIGWGGPNSEDGFRDEYGTQRNEIKCCGKGKFDPSSECCENKRAVAKVSIWVCRRKLRGPDSYWPKIGPISHTFIVCEDPIANPKTDKKFGKQPRRNNQASPIWGPGFVEKEPLTWNDFRDCSEERVCPLEKNRMCKEGPAETPYFLFSPWHNCHGWGNCRSQ